MSTICKRFVLSVFRWYLSHENYVWKEVSIFPLFLFFVFSLNLFFIEFICLSCVCNECVENCNLLYRFFYNLIISLKLTLWLFQTRFYFYSASSFFHFGFGFSKNKDFQFEPDFLIYFKNCKLIDSIKVSKIKTHYFITGMRPISDFFMLAIIWFIQNFSVFKLVQILPCFWPCSNYSMRIICQISWKFSSKSDFHQRFIKISIFSLILSQFLTKNRYNFQKKIRKTNWNNEL